MSLLKKQNNFTEFFSLEVVIIFRGGNIFRYSPVLDF